MSQVEVAGETERFCKTCGVKKAITEFYVVNKAKGWREGSCKTCRRIQTRAREAENPTAVKAKKRAYEAKNRDVIAKRKKAKRDSDAEGARAYARDWWAAEQERRVRLGLCKHCGKRPHAKSGVWCSECLEARRIYEQGYALRKKLEVYEAYGGAWCNCCGETELLFLCMDHVDNNGAEHRKELKAGGENRMGRDMYNWLKKNGFPPGFQVLCQNCNWGKYRNGGVCPHQAARNALKAA